MKKEDIAEHCADVKKRLTKLGCMDEKFQINITTWNQDVVKALEEGGHTSLDPETCRCVICKEKV